MKQLIQRLGVSVDHLECLYDVFVDNNNQFKEIDEKLNSKDFSAYYKEISRELYSGGKQPRGNVKLSRQMILGDIIEYIFTGRAFYYATKTEENLRRFYKLILLSVNQILLFDTITVDPKIRKKYIEALEDKIALETLYEKKGDQELAKKLKKSTTVIWTDGWKKYDMFVDSILPKTLGCPKELIVFAELIRLKIGNIIPLLLIQRLFGDKKPIAPPDFLIARENKELYGIEVGYSKEGQSREFSIRTSIPTFAIDLKNNMHNRCPKCGENILYCDPVIEAYSKGNLEQEVKKRGGKFFCKDCPKFDNGNCRYSNYYGRVNGKKFNGEKLDSKDNRHYHTNCVKKESFTFRNKDYLIGAEKVNEFFAQIPEIEGLDNL